MSKEGVVEIRVRYADTDQMGVVYYANYFVWLEVARGEFFRIKGIQYKDLETEKGISLPVIEAFCKYKSPARYDDVVMIKTRACAVKNTGLRFDYELIDKKSSQLLATAYTTHVFIDKERHPVRIPDEIKALF